MLYVGNYTAQTVSAYQKQPMNPNVALFESNHWDCRGD